MSNALNERAKKIEEIDALRILFYLEKEEAGRKKIALELSLGEGYARKLLDKIEKKKLIKKTKKGSELTDLGKSVIKKIKDLFFPIEGFKILGYENAKAVLVRGASGSVEKGLEERDEAVRYGAKGAMIIIYKGGKLLFPPSEPVMNVYKELDQAINSSAKLVEGDVVVITWGDSSADAERGAYAATIYLLEKAGKRIPSII